MNKYSRINSKSKSKSKSVPIDLCDHLSLSISETPPIISKPHEEKCNKNDDKCIDMINGEEGDGEMFGVILRRSRSVSSYKSMVEKERSSSMKRSSSVSSSSAAGAAGGRGGYCRIHHQNDNPISDEQADKFDVLHRNKEKGNKILRACSRLLGFR